MQRLKLLDSVSPSHFHLFTQGRHLLLKFLLLTVCHLQFPPHLLHLLIDRMDGFLVMPLFVHQRGIVLSNTGDDPFFRNTAILKGLDTNQCLKKHKRQSKK